ncbi:MAG: hypothetical protein HOJ54_10620, partial [Phycisphaerae bacterium]|nr:hypothetical protein [Phycisphaerae bacterium]
AREYITWDLRQDPTELLEADAEAIKARTFVRQDQLPDGVERFHIKGIKSNRAPFLVGDLRVLDSIDCERIGLDVEACRRHFKMLTEDQAMADAIAARISEVYAPSHATPADVDDALYNGFVGKQDGKLRNKVHTTEPELLLDLVPQFHDARLTDLLLNYRARNHAHLLDDSETARWMKRCANRLMNPPGRGDLAWPEWIAHVHTLLEDPKHASNRDRKLLWQVAEWGQELAASHGLAPPDSMNPNSA